MNATARRALAGLTLVAAFAAFMVLAAATPVWEGWLGALFPAERSVVHPGGTLLSLIGWHILIVAVSSGLTILVGLPLGIWVTRASGREFKPMVAAAVDFGQTFPPVAVLALAVPFLGFGFEPTIVALFLYGLFPVVSGTVSGLEAVPVAVVEAARGMGMSPAQMLLRVELPLASRVIISGIRTSVIVNIGTATVGAAIGAKGLGVPIIGGLVQQNMAYVLEGAVPAAVLAVLADAALGVLESTPPTSEV